jgi:catechol 2,3-dioxygenase-like lactoylglutathione lyase family enzyme
MIKSLDHLVLTTRDAAKCIDFYTRVLEMKLETFGQGRTALRFGDQKINLHDQNTVTDNYAAHPTPGSLDICFLADRPLDEVIARLRAAGIAIELGPVRRTGARFGLRSVYVRDPDQNLIEISEPVQ